MLGHTCYAYFFTQYVLFGFQLKMIIKNNYIFIFVVTFEFISSIMPVILCVLWKTVLSQNSVWSLPSPVILISGVLLSNSILYLLTI